MTGYTQTPRVARGAFAVYFSSNSDGTEDSSQSPTIVTFQYNPETIRRTVALKGPDDKGGKGAKIAGRRIQGFPDETITLSIELDATDAIAAADDTTLAYGLGPMLATLELLAHPPRTWEQDVRKQADAGKVAVKPSSAPLTLLVWGEARVAPVLLTNLAITEEAFDPKLNPILAKAEVTLRVLTTLELADSTLGVRAYGAYADKKWNLADKLKSADAAARSAAQKATSGG